MKKEAVNNSGGVGIVGIVQIIFLTLKIAKVIDWSWLWVLSPLWISLTGFIFLVCLGMFLSKFEDKNDNR